MKHETPHTRFGKVLRAELDRQQISARELARRINPSDPQSARRTIARWLTPDSAKSVNPSTASVRAVAKALGLEPSDLVGDDDSELPLSRDEQSIFFSLLKKVVNA